MEVHDLRPRAGWMSCLDCLWAARALVVPAVLVFSRWKARAPFPRWQLKGCISGVLAADLCPSFQRTFKSGLAQNEDNTVNKRR